MSERSMSLRLLAGATLSAGALLAGCTDVTPVPGSYMAYTELSGGPCLQPYEYQSEEIKDESAQNCLGVQQRGRIALVVFNEATSQPDALATEVEQTLAKATGNIVTTNIQPVAASAAAEKELSESIGKTRCVDSTYAAGFASVLAAETMPALASYDMVVAMPNVPACDNAAGGVTDGKQQHVDIYAPQDPSTDPEARKQRTVSDISHEVGHLFGWGHAGRLYGSKPDGQAASLQDMILPESPATFDLSAYIQTATYAEYAVSDNIMGYPDIKTTASEAISGPNPIQQEALSWPKVELGTSEPQAIPVTAHGVALNAAGTARGEFAAVELATPVNLTDWETVKRGHDGTHSFDRLILLPYNHQVEGAEPHVQFTDVYMADKENNIVDLGTLGHAMPGYGRTWKLKFDDQLITVRLDDGKLFVQAR